MLNALKQHFGEDLMDAAERNGDIHLAVRPERLREVAEFLNGERSLAFDYPADLTARDTGEQILLWYRLVSLRHVVTALIHVALPNQAPAIESVTSIWPGMNWHERECFDLYGVRFHGHPDDGDPAQMRILLPEDWEGHPFRRDYTPEFSDDPLNGPQERN
jgi:NADH-quinone oxidoreductase subunit C